MDELHKLRGELAKTDQELLHLFLRRMQIVSSVAKYKGRTQSTIFVPEQEVTKIRGFQAKTPPELASYATVLAQTLMRLSRERQYEILLQMDPNKDDHNLPECQTKPSQVETLAVVEGSELDLIQMAQELYPNLSLRPVKDAASACSQVAEGLLDMAFVPLRADTLFLLEKHALFIRACLSVAEERHLVVGTDLVQYSGAGHAGLLVHGRRKTAGQAQLGQAQLGETLLEGTLPLVINILSDLALRVVHIQQLGSRSFYLEILVGTSLGQVWRAISQLEQETGGIYLLGYYS